MIAKQLLKMQLIGLGKLTDSNAKHRTSRNIILESVMH